MYDPLHSRSDKKHTKHLFLALSLASSLLLTACGATAGGAGGGGISASSNAADFITPASRNIMRVNGMDAYDSNGQSITLGAFAKNYLDLLDSRLGTQATAAQVGVGLESGNSLYNALH